MQNEQIFLRFAHFFLRVFFLFLLFSQNVCGSWRIRIKEKPNFNYQQFQTDEISASIFLFLYHDFVYGGSTRKKRPSKKRLKKKEKLHPSHHIWIWYFYESDCEMMIPFKLRFLFFRVRGVWRFPLIKVIHNFSILFLFSPLSLYFIWLDSRVCNNRWAFKYL